MADYTIYVLAPNAVTVAGNQMTITSDTITTISVTDNDDLFDGDTGANEVGIDPTQVLTGTSTRVYAEQGYDITDGTDTWQVVRIESNGSVVGFGVIDGPGFPPTGTFTVFDTDNVNRFQSSAIQPSFSDFLVCFTRGTKIDTPEGPRTIEELQTGDLVRTLDNGDRPVRWIGSRRVPATGATAPVLFREGALGNTRPLRVSPNHRMLLQGWRVRALSGDSEALVAARLLINDTSVLREEGGEVEYFHILFDQHEIVFAEGIPSESFNPSERALDALSEAARDEVLSIFPELAAPAAGYRPTARPVLDAASASAVVGN